MAYQTMNTRFEVLDPSANHTLFPQQEDTIDRICEHIKAFPKTTGSGERDERFSVNHVIALLGDRGTGKTTALFRARQRIIATSKETGDLATDLFVPDVLHSEDAIGPAVIKVLGDALIARAQEMRQDYVTTIENKLKKTAEDLSWFSNDLVPEDVIARDSISAPQYSRKLFAYHQDSLLLPERFSTMLEEMTSALEIERIIFFIDDADINIDLIEKVLDFVRYFLATPRVVTIMAADLETLHRRLFNKRIGELQTDKLPAGQSLFGGSSESFQKREVELERAYVDAFLLKLLPPATRVRIPLLDHGNLYRHKVRFGESETASAETLLDEIRFFSTLEGRHVQMSSLVERYPGVLESNLRAFINQLTILSEIVKNYKEKNFLFFGVEEGNPDAPLIPGTLNLSGHVNALDQAAVMGVMRVFLSSTTHANWRDTWNYYGFIDVLTETTLSKLINVVVTRITNSGTAIDSFIYNIASDQGSQLTLSRKEETHVFNLIIDLALHFGADFQVVMRYLGLMATEAFRHFYLTESMLAYFETGGASISQNFTIVRGSSARGIAGSFSAEVDEDAIQPIYLMNARDAAVHFHFAARVAEFRRIDDRNQSFHAVLREENSTDEEKRIAERRQLYGILYFAMGTCTLQILSVVSIVSELDATVIPAPEIGHTSNTQLDWSIVNGLSGWSLLKKIFEGSYGTGAEECIEDYAMMVLQHIAQLPYEVMFACFSANETERRSHTDVIRHCKNFIAYLNKKGLIKKDRFVDDSTCRQIIASAEDLPRMKRATRLWPDVDFGRKGERLRIFLEYLLSDPETLDADYNLRANPPPKWREWVEDFSAHAKNVKKRVKAKASKTAAKKSTAPAVKSTRKKRPTSATKTRKR